MTDPAPLILTLRFDEDSFRLFDGLRRRHFPKARNHIPAHLTLFHHLPGDAEAEIAAKLSDLASITAALPLAITGLRFLGYGSAFTVESAGLSALRAGLATDWRDWLTPQDAQAFRPHVTIQNKAPAPDAKALFAELDGTFRPFDAVGTGLLLWRYRGGPWEAAGAYPFSTAG